MVVYLLLTSTGSREVVDGTRTHNVLCPGVTIIVPALTSDEYICFIGYLGSGRDAGNKLHGRYRAVRCIWGVIKNYFSLTDHFSAVNAVSHIISFSALLFIYLLSFSRRFIYYVSG